MLFATVLSFFLHPLAHGAHPCESALLGSIISHLEKPGSPIQVESSLQGLPWSNMSAHSWSLRHPEIVQLSIPETQLRMAEIRHLIRSGSSELLVLTDLGPSIWYLPDYEKWRSLAGKNLNQSREAKVELGRVLSDAEYCTPGVTPEICAWLRQLDPFHANLISPYGAVEILNVMARETLISRLIHRDESGKMVLLGDILSIEERTNLAALPLLLSALPFLKDFPVRRVLPKIFDVTWNSVPLISKEFRFRKTKGRFVVSLSRYFHPVTFGVQLRLHVDQPETFADSQSHAKARHALFEAIRGWVVAAINEWAQSRGDPMPILEMWWDASSPKTLIIELDQFSYDPSSSSGPNHGMSNQERLLFSLFLAQRPIAHRSLKWR